MRRRRFAIALLAALGAWVSGPSLSGTAIDQAAAAIHPDGFVEGASANEPGPPGSIAGADRGDGRRPVAPSRPSVVQTTAVAAATSDTLEPGKVLLGGWSVSYVGGPENGQGVNIELPLRRLDGLVIPPGATFEFWRAVGEVSQRTGYRRGAVIVGNRIDPQGALAGGICTVSTVVFNAAARAGLQILARTGHSGYLAKYPLGLDAAVAKGPGFRQTLAFRNDTDLPIVMRTRSEPGTARVDLYAATGLDRRVEFGRPSVRDRRAAHDRHVASRSLAVGERRRVHERTDGMTVTVVRTVRDAAGRIVHRDRWTSRYRPLDGLVIDGAG